MFPVSPARVYVTLLLTKSIQFSVLSRAANLGESLSRDQVPSDLLWDRLLKSNNNLAVDQDETVIMKCDSPLISEAANKFHGAVISWMKNGKQMEFEWNRMSYKNHNIVIDRAEYEDSGVYLCLVEYSEVVNDADVAELYALTVKSNNTLLRTQVGKREILTCHSTAFGLLFRGKSKQRWYRDGALQRDYGNVSPEMVDNDTFLFTNTSLSGLWTCEVTANGNTWVTNRLAIEVKGSFLGFVYWPFIREYKYHLIVSCVAISELVPVLMIVLWILRKVDITATKKKYEENLMQRWLEERRREEKLLRKRSRKAKKHKRKTEKKMRKKQRRTVDMFVQYILLKSKKMEENLSQVCGQFVDAAKQQGATQAYANTVREKSTKLEKKLDSDVQKFVSQIDFDVHVDNFVKNILATSQDLEKRLHSDVKEFSEGIVGHEERQQLEKTLNRQVDTFVEQIIHGITIGKYVSDVMDKSKGQKVGERIKVTGNKESHESIKMRVGEIIKSLKKHQIDRASHEKDWQAFDKVDDKAVNKFVIGILKKLKVQETRSTDERIKQFLVDERKDETIGKYVAHILRKSKKQEAAQYNRAIQRNIKDQDEVIGNYVGNILDKYKKGEVKRMEREVDKFVDDIVQNEALRAHVLSQKQTKDPKVGDEQIRAFVDYIIGKAKKHEEKRLDQEVEKFVNDRILHETIRRHVGDVLESRKQEAKRLSLEIESFVGNVIQDEAIKKYVGDILDNSRKRVQISYKQ